MRPRYTYLDHGAFAKVGGCLYSAMAFWVRLGDFLRIGRKSELVKLRMQKKLEHRLEQLRGSDVKEIQMNAEEEKVFVSVPF